MLKTFKDLTSAAGLGRYDLGAGLAGVEAARGTEAESPKRRKADRIH